jgi:excisionase family DNA binding protein
MNSMNIGGYMNNLIMTTIDQEDFQSLIKTTVMECLETLPGKVNNDYHPEKDEIYNTTQAAKFLKISRMTLHRRMNEGSVPHRRLGRRIMFSKLELTFMAQGTGGV